MGGVQTWHQHQLPQQTLYTRQWIRRKRIDCFYRKSFLLCGSENVFFMFRKHKSYWIQAFPSSPTANVKSRSLNVEVWRERPGGNSDGNKNTSLFLIAELSCFSSMNDTNNSVIKGVSSILLFVLLRQESYCIRHHTVADIPSLCVPKGVSTKKTYITHCQTPVI